jgi:putative tryptophan/tyrosine transport system substrate-binding protein
MKRREFISMFGSAAAAWPLPARAQQAGRMRRIGVLSGYARNDAEAEVRHSAFMQSLQEFGWTEGRNILVETRFAGGEPLLVRAYAAELVAMSPDVIVCSGSPVTLALQRATHTVPIVFVLIADPIGTGLVADLARPGGNITGFINYEFSIGGKWLDLLRQIAPKIISFLVVLNPDSPGSVGLLREVEAAAQSFGLRVTAKHIRNATEIERAISEFEDIGIGGMLVLPDATISVHRELLIALATRYRLPGIYPFRFFAADGGLVSYGVDTTDLFRRAASYVDRILKGASPAELPVQHPTKFELVINLKTAKTLGLDVPLHLQQLADEVIE